MFKKWSLLINQTSGSILEDSFKWYSLPTSGIYIWYQSCKMMVPQVILNFKWSSNEECIPHLQELKCIKWMTHAITQGDVSHKLISRSKILCVVPQEARHKIQVAQVTSGIYKWCHSNNHEDVHKKCKIQASIIYPKCIPLHQWEAHLLWKLMTKGERLYKDMKALRLRLYKGER